MKCINYYFTALKGQWLNVFTHQSLYSAWNNEQRVKALKLCIQLSKLLIDTSAPQFYPSKFVLITDILIKFGELDGWISLVLDSWTIF